MIVGGLQKRSISLCGNSVSGTWGGGAPFWGIQKDMGRRAQGTEITLRGGPLGNSAGGSSTEDLKRLWRQAPYSTRALSRIMGGLFTGNSDSRKVALDMGHLPLFALCEGNLKALMLDIFP